MVSGARSARLPTPAHMPPLASPSGRLLAVLCLTAATTRLASAALSLGVATDYNVFVLGNMSESGSDAEGRVAVAGNASLNGYSAGSALQNASAGNALVVGGNLNFSNGQVSHGNAVYGGSLTGNVAVPNGQLLHSSAAIDFTSAANTLKMSSTYWSTLSPNGATVNNYGGINLVGTNPELNVFSVTGDMLSHAWGMTIDVPAGATVLVNISGTSNNFQYMGVGFSDVNGDHTGSTTKQKVVYNFYESRSLTVSGISVQGSVLAPLADLSFSNGNIEGTVIANNLNGNGEAHNYPFTGSLPGLALVAVPEPSAAALATTLPLLIALRRRRA